jgi:hypothetical protein
MAEWQPIETAPKDGTEILAARKPRQFNWWIFDVVSYAWEDDNGHWWQHDGSRACQPTHWMHLPPPPTVDHGARLIASLDAAIEIAKELKHWSDCAVHNEPAFPNGPCNCGGYRE